jgi:hypothetical protein
MPSPYILVTVVPSDPTFRLIRIGPGGDPSDEPLLSHAGVIIDDKWHAEVALQGLTGVSRKLRRFWTRVGKDWDEMELKFMAESINMDGPDYFEAVGRGKFPKRGIPAAR